MSKRRESGPHSVLVVDDDKFGLSFLCSSLKVAGYEVVSASSAAQARDILTDRSHSFAAVLTDFRMPGESGLELLQWVRAHDETLSTIIITAEGEKELVKRSLAGGAVGFLDKPLTHEQLVESIGHAVRQTERLRRFAENETELAAVGRLDEFLNAQVSPDVFPYLQLYYQPLQDIGGDFLSVRRVGRDRFRLIVGDVSGHNVTAGYVSAYFQGLVRAGLEDGRPIEESLGMFNRILCEEWAPAAANRREILTSLAIVTLEIDLERMEVSCNVAGFPPPLLVDEHGFASSVDGGSFPLGWLPGGLERAISAPLRRGGALLVFSDGVTEWADQLEIDPLALAFTLLTAENRLSELVLAAPDDLILVRFQTDPEIPVNEQFQPIIRESYAGAEVENIDRVEAVWRRSLVFALEEELGERIFDLLICIREAVLNAMIHGCDRSPGKVCTLFVSYRASDQRIRVRVDDPGQGHVFNIEERLAKLPSPSGGQLGLGMIQHLSDEVSFDNRGTSLVFDFLVESSKHPNA